MAVEGGRFVARVVGATLDVAPKGFGFAGVVAPKVLEWLVGCMWGCSGRLGRMGRVWGTPKSNEVVAKAATGWVGEGLAVGCCGWCS